MAVKHVPTNAGRSATGTLISRYGTQGSVLRILALGVLAALAGCSDTPTDLPSIQSSAATQSAIERDAGAF